MNTHSNTTKSSTSLSAVLILPGKLQPQAVSKVMHAVHHESVVLNYGKCSQCSCPGFVGSGYTCTRSGCGHHYDEHG